MGGAVLVLLDPKLVSSGRRRSSVASFLRAGVAAGGDGKWIRPKGFKGVAVMLSGCFAPLSLGG